MQVLAARQIFTDYFSDRAPLGRKHDLKDAERLLRRLIANDTRHWAKVQRCAAGADSGAWTAV